MPTLADLDARFPHLAEWMKGAKPSQLWSGNYRADPCDGDAFREYEPLEATLRTLYAAGPARLDSKRREFRAVQTAGEMRGLQTELAFAAKLARHGVAFDFGAAGTPQPDLVLRDLDLGIELTAKKADALWDLKWHLRMALNDVQPSINLGLTFSAIPYSIRTKVRDGLTEEIRRAAQEGEREIYCVVRPSKPGEPAITVRAAISRGHWFRWPRIYVEEGGERHQLAIADAERAIVAAMEEKRKKRQGQSMPTLLLVDISDVRHARQRSNSTWLKELSKSLRAEHVFVGLGVLYASWWGLDATVAIAENKHADLRALNDLRGLGRALNLRVIDKDEPSRVRAPLLHDY